MGFWNQAGLCIFQKGRAGYMRAGFRDMPISRKTVLLLFLFVLIPSVLAGSGVIWTVYERNVQTNHRLVLQKLENRSQSIEEFMENVQEMGTDFAAAPCVIDILKYGRNSLRYYECSNLIKNTIKYNGHIQKVQIISDGKVIWNYGKDARYIFDDSGNEEYASRIESGSMFELWSPAHRMYSLERGSFSEACWMTTYYRGIVDTRTMSVLGVLAIQVLEEDYCTLYEDILENTPVAAWIENEEGDVMSATQKAFLEEGLPSYLAVGEEDSKTSSYIDITYQGKPAVLYRQKCGRFENYVLLLNEKTSMYQYILGFVLLIGLLFLLFCIGFLLLYRVLVIRHLEKLSLQVESARRLAEERKERESISLKGAAMGYKSRPSGMSQKGDEIRILTDRFQEMLGEIDILINKVYMEKIKSQQAEQQALLSQINPHFLYNTLDSIHWNALRNGDRETGDQLEALSSMLRETLNFGHKHTTVEREVSIVQNYCFLLEARFHREIEFSILSDPSVMQEQIPKLILQPLIENAYRHGLENKIGNKKITVKVKKAGENILFYVADNGAGCDRAKILRQMEEDGKECFALKNIRDRLRLEYGDAAGFHFWSREGTGTIVKLTLPLS